MEVIKSVILDEVKRILIAVEPEYEEYLHNDYNKQLLKKAAVNVLKDDFQKLEIGKNICRITVKSGTEEKNLQIIKTELVKHMKMALMFLKR